MSYLAQCAEAVISDLEFLERSKRASGKPFYADCVRGRIDSLKAAIEQEKVVKDQESSPYVGDQRSTVEVKRTASKKKRTLI